MKISIKDIAVHVEQTNSPFQYFAYIPHTPTFENQEDEERWIRRMKICLHQKMCENPQMYSSPTASHHIAYLPHGVIDTVEPLVLPDDFYATYNEGWCAVLSHPPQKDETLSKMLDEVHVPGHYTIILMPQGEKMNIVDMEDDFIDAAAKRFLILVFGIFILLWIMSIMP